MSDKEGFCLGRRRVDEVIRWSEPVDGQAELFFTWKMSRRAGSTRRLSRPFLAWWSRCPAES